MNQPTVKADPSCMDDYDPDSLLADDAIRRICDQVAPVEGVEKVAIRSALQRILATDLHSTIDVPGQTNSAMDGYALQSGDLPDDGSRTLKVVGTAWAGRPFEGAPGPAECVRIMTGAPMPAKMDTVVMQEHASRDGDFIRIDARHKPGQNVRAAGEDIAAGECVLPVGKRITPADLGLMASLGIGEIRVRRRIRAAFFSTGDELRSIGEPLASGMIYDSNRYTLYGMLARLGADILDMGVIPDRREDTFKAFRDAAGCADVLITSGGVSVGDADFVKEALDATGRVEFWKVAMKPGRPLAFGSVGDALFFGLPGNPVSVMVTFYLFVQPALRRLMGELAQAPLLLKARSESRLRKKAGRTEYQRGVLMDDTNGDLVVKKTGPQGSGILTSMSEANCFVILPLEAESVEPGDIVTVLPFSEIA
jgi:molybdopterin molybdotransferase